MHFERVWTFQTNKCKRRATSSLSISVALGLEAYAILQVPIHDLVSQDDENHEINQPFTFKHNA